jgi:hypothetical protein
MRVTLPGSGSHTGPGILLGWKVNGTRFHDTSGGLSSDGYCRVNFENGGSWNVPMNEVTILGSGSDSGLPSVGQRVSRNNISIGLRVKRGPDWSYGDQDGGGAGKVLGWQAGGTSVGESPGSDLWAKVRWDSGGSNNYEIGADGDYCLSVAEGGAGAGGLSVGDRVALREGAEQRGPLANGRVGTLVEDDGSSVPYKCEFGGETYWYTAADVVKAGTEAGDPSDP